MIRAARSESEGRRERDCGADMGCCSSKWDLQADKVDLQKAKFGFGVCVCVCLSVFSSVS